MSVRRTKSLDPKTGEARPRYMIDVTYEHPDGRVERVRKISPVQTRRGAEEYERQVRAALLNGSFGRKEEKAAPTLGEFKERFIDDWCRANHQKPSGIEGKESYLRTHLVPLFGRRRLDSFTAADEDKLKRHLVKHARATYNNAASPMNTMLRAAVRWHLIRAVPHHFQLLKRQKAPPRFYDFDQFDWLVEAAEKLDRRTLLVVLLGGEAGLRRGEMIALEWSNVDLRRGLLTIERSEWTGKLTETKGMKYRVVPMTKRLQRVLQDHRHLRGPRVLYRDDGGTATAKVLRNWIASAQRRANLRATGALHALRHTFCSHLAMKGAPALTIQQLAGHESLVTTLRYMHLSPGETDRAIRLLDERLPGERSPSARPAAQRQPDGNTGTGGS